MSVIRTRTAAIDVVDGQIVVARIGNDVQTVDDARENLAACAQFAAPDRKPLLVDIRAARPLLPEVRQQYMGERFSPHFAAMGLLVRGNPLGITMGNVYLKLARPGIPTRIFVEERKGLEWLRARR